MGLSLNRGQKYDGCSIELDLCCNCFDKLMDWLEPQCKYNPIIGKVFERRILIND